MQKSSLTNLFSAAVADATSITMNVDDFDVIVIQYSAWGGTTTATTKFQGSVSVDSPDFSAVQSATNHWDYVDVIDMEDGGSIDGDTGIASAAAHFSQYEVNVKGLKYFAATLDWTAGEVTINVYAKNYNPV